MVGRRGRGLVEQMGDKEGDGDGDGLGKGEGDGDGLGEGEGDGDKSQAKSIHSFGPSLDVNIVLPSQEN